MGSITAIRTPGTSRPPAQSTACPGSPMSPRMRPAQARLHGTQLFHYISAMFFIAGGTVGATPTAVLLKLLPEASIIKGSWDGWVAEFKQCKHGCMPHNTAAVKSLIAAQEGGENCASGVHPVLLPFPWCSLRMHLCTQKQHVKGRKPHLLRPAGSPRL